MPFLFNPMKSATEMVRKVRVTGVLTSLLWLLPFLIAALVVISFTDNTVVQSFFMFITATVIIVLLGMFIILCFKDPNSLRSETHIFNMKRLELLGDQDHGYEDFKDSPAENNPILPKPRKSKMSKSKKINLGKEKNDR